MKHHHGFTLIELMIVVAIILIIVAVAIPNLLRSRMLSNESSAVGNLRTIVGAEMAYHASNYAYTGAFNDLTTASPAFLDGNWAAPKGGYTFTLVGDAAAFAVNADPVDMGVSGSGGYFTDASGVVRYAEGAGATAASDPISH